MRGKVDSRGNEVNGNEEIHGRVKEKYVIMLYRIGYE